MKNLLKILIAIFAIFLLFYLEIVSIDALVIFIENLEISDLLILIFLIFFLMIGTYFRWFFCTFFLNLDIPKKGLINISSEAYTYGQIIPGQLGIDGWRILRYKDLDNSKFKSKLLAITIIEKIVSIISQLTLFLIFFIIFFDVHISLFKVILFSIALIVSSFLALKVFKYIIFNRLKVNLRSLNIIYLLKIFLFAILLNTLACFLIFTISNIMLEGQSLSFIGTSMSMLASNISAAIPITPNGIGISEFMYSKIISVISDGQMTALYGTSYLLYRILNILGHLLIYITTTISLSINGNKA